MTFVEYTSRISNKLRELESGFKEPLPPKLKGFIIKRQAKLTHDQAKHLHFYIPTRRLEADKMVDAPGVFARMCVAPFVAWRLRSEPSRVTSGIARANHDGCGAASPGRDTNTGHPCVCRDC